MAPDQSFAHRTLAQKLGLKPGDAVAAVGAPAGFADLLGALPDGARLTASPTASTTRYLWFVTSRRQLDLALARLTAVLTTEVAWLVWPKAASGMITDLTGNDVREAGLAAGLVDFKVCSVDETWSALAFKRRGATPARVRR